MTKNIDAVAMLREALKGVIRVADRATDEFDAARAALAATDRDGEPFGLQVTKLVSDIRDAKSLAWRDSLIENLLELIELSAATPKPEESAATQQAGEVDWICDDGECGWGWSGPASPAPHCSFCARRMSLAAPISEDTQYSIVGFCERIQQPDAARTPASVGSAALEWYDREQAEGGITRDSFHLFVLGLFDTRASQMEAAPTALEAK